MNILFLTQIIPYPPDAGPRVKTWHVLRYLAGRGHRVVLASFVRPEEEPYLDAVRQVCAEVHTVPIHRSRLADVGYWLRSHFSGRPFLIERDDLVGMRDLVRRLVEGQAIDAIHADQLGMAQFALPYRDRFLGRSANGKRPAPALVFDAHNAVWTIVERMQQNAPWFLRPVAALEAQRVKRYEGKIVSCFNHTLAVAEPDRQALLEAVKSTRVESLTTRVERRSENAVETPLPSLHVVPIAVDTRELQPINRRPGSFNILTLGTLHYPPNADGIRWFARQVFPQVRQACPQTTLTIIGKNPPADFQQLAAQQPDVVRVTGYVPDLTPYMEEAALVVVAVRAGGGMRVRILEAFARGMPVVTTTVGLEGIDARPGEDVLVADEPQALAAAVVRVLNDPALQARLAENGRRLAEQRYDWQVILKEMDAIYAHGRTETHVERG